MILVPTESGWDGATGPPWLVSSCSFSCLFSPSFRWQRTPISITRRLHPSHLVWPCSRPRLPREACFEQKAPGSVSWAVRFGMVSLMMSSRDRCGEQRFLEHSRPVHCEGWSHGVHDALIPTYKVILHAKRVSVLRLPREACFDQCFGPGGMAKWLKTQ